jgi:biopolymer transport protein TolR|tara:strand:- start:86 stop:502 length:417 start_codon:yes stop_codon:yes gene_type:complete
MSDINVTPFVDVMLVLLVIFMVTAPLLTVGVPVDLPKAQASLIQEPDEPLSVSIDFEGRVYVQDSEIALRKLTARLIAVTGANPDIRIFVRGDKTIDYGRVMQVIGTINAAGFKRVALITEMPDRVTLPQKKLNKVAK